MTKPRGTKILDQNSVQTCAQLIKEAKSIVALTGAGVSTSAGIPDFRGPEGLYVTKRYDADKVFDINYFYQDPKPFFEFARDFMGLEEKMEPTFTHRFLAQLESSGKLKGIVTQNIDGLHQKAGAENIFEIHGGISQGFCLICNKLYSYDEIKLKLTEHEIPTCSCGGVIKPDIVFFGENVKHILEATTLATNADLFFVIGTSCVVYPAAMLPEHTQGRIVIVNMSPVELTSGNVVLKIQSDIDEFFRQVSKRM